MSSLSEVFDQSYNEELDILHTAYEGEEVFASELGAVWVYDCTFTRCSISRCRFDHTILENLTFEGCDLSGCTLLDCGLKNVVFRNCRLTGATFSGCVLSGVTFEDCSAGYVTLSGCTLKQCRLQGGTFAEGSLAGCRIKKTTVSRCDFTRCDFTGAEIGEFDFSDSKIDGAIWSLDKLRGVSVNMNQALELSRLLGLNIVL